jgi:hypothetical protein
MAQIWIALIAILILTYIKWLSECPWAMSNVFVFSRNQLHTFNDMVLLIKALSGIPRPPTDEENRLLALFS